MLKYLARYLAGGPIPDGRIVSTDDQSVTFMARTGETTGGDAKQVPMTLSQVEFTRRWSLHVLPAGYTRTRRFGGWSNTRRKVYLETFALQLGESFYPLSAEATEFDPENFGSLKDLCTGEQGEAAEFDAGMESKTAETKQKTRPKCGSSLIPQRLIDKPSWARVMNSPHRPPWYLRPDRSSSG